MEGYKIFLVEFGKPDLSNFVSFGRGQDPVFVLAKDYNEASKKALLFAEERLKTQKSNSILDSDGSLILDNADNLQVKSVKIVSNEIIM